MEVIFYVVQIIQYEIIQTKKKLGLGRSHSLTQNLRKQKDVHEYL